MKTSQWPHLDAGREDGSRGDNDRNAFLAQQPFPSVNDTTARGILMGLS